MKNNAFRLISYVIGIVYFFSLFYFGLPWWLIFLFVPVLTYVQIYLTFQASGRESLVFEPIPDTGYEKRLKALDTNEAIFSQFGFRKFDEFHLRTIPDLICYVYHHEQYPILAQHMHADALEAIAFETKFENGASLETSNSKNAGLITLEKTKMLQAFPGRSFDEILHKHFESVNYLRQNGYMPKPLSLPLFRQELMDELKIQLRKTKTLSAPIRMFYRLYFGKRNIYQKSIQAQQLAKTLALP